MALPPSKRGLANLVGSRIMNRNHALDGKMDYDKDICPDGLIDVSGAVNVMMNTFWKEYMQREFANLDLNETLNYGDVMGPPELHAALASYFNEWFSPSVSIKPSNIIVTNGVTSTLDMIAYNICDAGEGILCLTPTYSMFEHDICAHNGINLIQVSTNTIADQFAASSADALVAVFRQACMEAAAKGTKVKGILICNPSNPEGRFYSRETLERVAAFCGQMRLHLIADEIYGMTGFESPDYEKDLGLDGFTSLLAISNNPETGVHVENLHVLYGIAKDFGLGGLRLGFLVTRNEEVWKTSRRLAPFTWVTKYSATVFTHFIADKGAVAAYHRQNKAMLRDQYSLFTTSLKKHGVPYKPANGCLFVWLQLTKWVKYFNRGDIYREHGPATREMQLVDYLIEKGVYMSPGEFSYSSIPGCFRYVYTIWGEGNLVAAERLGEALKELEKRKISETNTVYLEDSDGSSIECEKGRAMGPRLNSSSKPSIRRLLSSISCFGQQ